MSDDDPHLKLKLIMHIILVVLILLFLISNVNVVTAPVVEDTVEPLKVVFESDGSRVAPLQVSSNSTHIVIIGAYCTCGKYPYKRMNNTIKNYDYLYFEIGDYYGTDYTSPEGLIVDERTDADYCLITGNNHFKGHKGLEVK